MMIRSVRGFALLDVALAASVMSIVAAIALAKHWDDWRDQSAENQGRAVASVANALNAMISQNYGSLLRAQNWDASIELPEAGNTTRTKSISRISAPTVEELASLRFLPAGFRSNAPAGGTIRLSIYKDPADCIPPNCNIAGYVYVDRPLEFDHKVDFPRLGLAVRAIGPDGAASDASTPSTISALSSEWTAPNPAGAVSGTLAARVGYQSSVWGIFFRVDGSVPMANHGKFGDPTIDTAWSLQNAKQVETAYKVLNSPCGASDADPDDQFDTTKFGATAVGQVQTADGVKHEVPMICRNNLWQIAAGSVGNPGDPCSPEGAIVVSLPTGEELVCKGGVLIRVISTISRNIEVATQVVQDGDFVPYPALYPVRTAPACDKNGVPKVWLEFNQSIVDVSTPGAAPFQSTHIFAADVPGSGWRVNIKLLTNPPVNNVVSGNGYGPLTAVAHVQCQYPQS